MDPIYDAESLTYEEKLKKITRYTILSEDNSLTIEERNNRYNKIIQKRIYSNIDFMLNLDDSGSQGLSCFDIIKYWLQNHRG
jgi:hypothetical protein